MIESESRVITLGTSSRGAILNVASAHRTLVHLLGHVAEGGLPQERVEFFDPSGKIFVLRVDYEQERLTLKRDAETKGIGLEALQQRVRDVMRQKYEAVTEHARLIGMESPDFPLDRPWDEQLDRLSGVVDDMADDRRGVWHNLFVHGGNP